MDFWFFIAAIAIAGSYFKHRTEVAKLGAKIDHIEDSGVQQELDHMKQRLAVLERIITDKGYELNEEFEDLHKEQNNKA